LVFKKLSTFKRHLLNAAEQLFSVAASVKWPGTVIPTHKTNFYCLMSTILPGRLTKNTHEENKSRQNTRKLRSK
jgi:hypothetical protein